MVTTAFFWTVVWFIFVPAGALAFHGIVGVRRFGIIASGVLALAQISINGQTEPEGARAISVIHKAPQPPTGEAESPTGRNPRFIWTKRWQFNYQRARAENHSSWQRIKSAADGNEYGDFGQWAALVYQITGDKTYGQKAIAKILPQFDPRRDANYVREYYAELVVIYDWLLPAMTAEQKATCEAGLVKFAEYSLAINQPVYVGGFRLSDSDQTVGQYFGLVLTDLALGTKYAETSEGLAARDAVKSYIAKAAGGQWIESTEYNLGTTKLLWMGVEAIKTATGQDHFPEATAYFAELKQSLMAELTPDAKDSFQWGDTEKPHNLDFFHRGPVNVLMGLRGVIPDSTAYWNYLQPRAFYYADPFATRTAPQAQSLRADGVGILLVKDKSKLFCSHMANDVGVDHAVRYLNHFALWANGEWVIDAPRGYVGDGNFNGMKLAGLLSMYDRKLVKSRVAADYAYQVGWTGGPYFDVSGFWNPPPTFCRAWIRTVVYLPEFPAVVVYDSIDMDDPKTLPQLDRYSARSPWDLMAIQNAPALKQWILHVPVQPTVTGNVVKWTTAGNQPVTLTTFCDQPYTVKVSDETKDPAYTQAYFPKSELRWNLSLLSDKATKFMNAVTLGDTPVQQIPGGVQVGQKKITFTAEGTPKIQ